MIQLSFHGAAETVTGSKYLLETAQTKLLIDCGVFQGARELRQRNWQDPPFEPASIDAVILSHAHIDHIGYLPRLVRQGFTGKVVTTPPTKELAAISLLDAAHIQEEDAAWRNKKKITRYEQALPLYTVKDAENALMLLQEKLYRRWYKVGPDVKFRYHVVGHLLGAAAVEVMVTENGKKTTILFSGDVGRYGNPLTIDPANPPQCDYLVCESTYGGRLHDPVDPRATFTELINDIIKHKNVLLIPAFAIGRTQQIAYLVNELIRHGLIPSIDIHIDSPMAVSATDVYTKYHSYHRMDIANLGGENCILGGRNVFLHRKRHSSKQLNILKGPAIIMSSSGMLTGGRIMHHLMQRLPDPRTTVALVGYQAYGTPGRALSEGATELRIHKETVPVKARVIHHHGLSGHADFHEIMHWLEPIKKAPRRVFVTHGEVEQSEAMAGHFREERGWDCHLPKLGETVEL